jgi:hypothetical protein
MDDFSYGTDANLKRLQKVLEIAVEETERRKIQGLLAEEVAKALSELRPKADLQSA